MFGIDETEVGSSVLAEGVLVSVLSTDGLLVEATNGAKYLAMLAAMKVYIWLLM